jgi:outer membrane protein assembly factor BamB
MKKSRLTSKLFGIAVVFLLFGVGLAMALPFVSFGNQSQALEQEAKTWHIGMADTQSMSAIAPWPMYGHDSNHTCRSSANGPTYSDVKWTYNLGVRVQDNASPVIAADGTVYVPSECGFFAINPDGTLKWKQWGTAPWDLTHTRMAPAVANDGSAVYVYAIGILTYRLYALDPVDGDIIWFYDIGYSTYGSPSIGLDGTIYIGGIPEPSAGSSHMYAINPDGTLKWCWEDTGGGCWIETSPAIGPSGEVYFQHNCLGLVALESNGQLKWSHNGALGQAWNSPSIGPDGTIYIGSSDHYFYALNPDGTVKWKVSVDNFMYEAAAALSSGGSTIYRGDNMGIFYAFDSSGYLKWKCDTGIDGEIQCAPALAANGIIYFTQGLTSAVVPSDKGYLYALRASDGTLVWKYEIGWSTSSPVIAADGTLYAVGGDTSGNGVLYAFRSTPNQTPSQPSNPSPANHATGASINADLSWTGGDPDTGDTVTYDVYFGTSSSPPLVSNDQSGTIYDPGTLAGNTKYYWKVVATDNHGASTTGALWDFTTVGEWDPWAYDEDDSGYTEIGELLHAISDYIGGGITISQLLEIINLYISHTPKP